MYYYKLKTKIWREIRFNNPPDTFRYGSGGVIMRKNKILGFYEKNITKNVENYFSYKK